MFLQEKVSDINRRLEALRSVCDIVIWGAGRHTCKLFEWTNILTYNVTGIVDISKEKQGNPFFGFVIQAPEGISWNDVKAVVISVPGQEMTITEMLIRELGFKGNIVTLYESNKCTPFYLLYDEKVPSIQFFGDYDSWSAAYKECDGYESANILDTVSKAINKVVNGEASWERDGYLFYEPKYVYCLCAAVLKCAIQNENKGVRILDIGGALGSTYFQNRNYLKDVKNIEYIVAEQDNFADYGHQYLENEFLKFILSTEHWDEKQRFDIILLSGSLQCIEQYEEIISKINKAKPRYIIIDRIMIGKKMRICREIVPDYIYKSSYPIRVFSEEQIEYFFKDYKMVERDASSVAADLFFIDEVVHSHYYVFEFQDKSKQA